MQEKIVSQLKSPNLHIQIFTNLKFYLQKSITKALEQKKGATKSAAVCINLCRKQVCKTNTDLFQREALQHSPRKSMQ